MHLAFTGVANLLATPNMVRMGAWGDAWGIPQGLKLRVNGLLGVETKKRLGVGGVEVKGSWPAWGVGQQRARGG